MDAVGCVCVWRHTVCAFVALVGLSLHAMLELIRVIQRKSSNLTLSEIIGPRCSTLPCSTPSLFLITSAPYIEQLKRVLALVPAFGAPPTSMCFHSLATSSLAHKDVKKRMGKKRRKAIESCVCFSTHRVCSKESITFERVQSTHQIIRPKQKETCLNIHVFIFHSAWPPRPPRLSISVLCEHDRKRRR